MPGFDGFVGGMGLLGLAWFVLMMLFASALIVFVVLGIRWLLQNTGSGLHATARPASSEDSALALLRERFARGEIDATEFEERKRTLGG